MTESAEPGKSFSSIMELFRAEVDAHAASLMDGFMSLTSLPDFSGRIQPMLKELHAIKGGAKVVDLEEAVTVVQAIEGFLKAVHDGKIKPVEEQVGALVEGVQLLDRIAEAACQGETGWKSDIAEDMDNLVHALGKDPAGRDRLETVPDEIPREGSNPLSSSEGENEEIFLKAEGEGDSAVISDPALLDLFQTETQTHVAMLNDGLLVLEENPGATDQLEALMRAAHSIKGGARIVGMDAVVRVAHVMEDCFVAAQKNEITLRSEQIDILLRGVDIINHLSEVMDGAKPPSAEYDGEIETFVAAVKELLAHPDVAPGGEGVIKNRSAEQIEDPFSSSEISEPSGQGDLGNADSNVISDPALLDLFQAEVETHVAVLSDGLLALENNPGATDQLEALMRAAHSIKGGARIVGLDAAVRVAHVMEDCFVAAQKGEVLLGSEQIDILLQIVDILIQLSRSLVEGETDWLMRHRVEIDRLVDAIAKIVGRESAINVSPVEKVVPDEGLSKESPMVSSEETSAVATIDVKNPVVIHEKQGADVPQIKAFDKDRTIRVTAGKIERLIGQAGEVVVNAGWLPSFSEGLLKLKRRHMELFAALDELKEVLLQSGADSLLADLANQARQKTKDCSLILAERLNQIDLFNSSSASLSDRLYHEVISVRMRPFSDGVKGFPRMVRDLARDLSKKVRLEIRGKTTEVDRDILEMLDAPLSHLLRNAIDHGMESPEDRLKAGKSETGMLLLEATHRSGMLMVTVSDDGCGVDFDKLKEKIVRKGLSGPEMVQKMTEQELLDFLFLPGFSTAIGVTEISGRGVGLDVVRNMTHEVGGVVRAFSKPGQGLTVHMELPITLSVVRTFLVEIAGESYAFPLARIERCLKLSRDELDTVEDRQYFRFDENNIALVDVWSVLELDGRALEGEALFVVVISDRLNFYGLAVDRFLGECDLVVRPLDPRLGKVPDVSSVAVTLEGAPVLIFDVEDLVRSIDNLLSGRRLKKVAGPTKIEDVKKKKRILVVDDSFTVREMERKLLESKGYQVETAVDGVDGWNAVRSSSYDMIVSDVDMPRMNGIELVTNIKKHPVLKSLPVIIVSYKDKEEDRLKGLEAGANYYLTKGSFQDDSLINAAEELIGEP